MTDLAPPRTTHEARLADGEGGEVVVQEELLQRLALVIGHAQPEVTVLGLAHVVNHADVRMVQGRRRPGLPQKPLAGLLVPNYDAFWWNNPITRANGAAVYGF